MERFLVKHISAGLLVAVTVTLLGSNRAGASSLFVGNSGDNTITRFDNAGNPTTFARGLNAPTGLAFDAGGNLYVANQFANSIEKFSPMGVDLGSFATSGMASPTGLAFDAAGNLYVANTGNGTIRKFSPTGIDLGNFATGLNFPEGIAFDRAGNLYVANNGGGINGSSTIHEFSPTGTDLGNFATTGLSSVYGLAFDATGNLYAANNLSGTVRKFSATGTDLGNFVTGQATPGVQSLWHQRFPRETWCCHRHGA
jgi:sugar lactone lactonase YvrE